MSLTLQINKKLKLWKRNNGCGRNCIRLLKLEVATNKKKMEENRTLKCWNCKEVLKPITSVGTVDSAEPPKSFNIRV